MSLIPLGILSAAAKGKKPIVPFPSGITGLIARYDAQDTGSISLSGSDVTQWNDLSGNNRHATQGTSTNRPKSGTRTLNGFNVIDFDGSNDFLINDGVAGSITGEDKPFTIFVVKEADSGGNLTAIALNRSTSSVPYIWDYADALNFRDDANGESYLTYDAVGTNPKYYAHRTTGLSYTAWVNGTQTVSATAYNRGTITLNRGTIGAYRGTSTPEFFFNGAIGEIIYYNRELTTSEVNQVNDYLGPRWGL